MKSEGMKLENDVTFQIVGNKKIKGHCLVMILTTLQYIMYTHGSILASTKVV
jgi:hypothetical protein